MADQIRDQILNGELTEGGSLPSVERLMDRIGISRSTLRQAFRVLEAEGLISVPRGSRTGVKIHSPSAQSGSLATLREIASKIGRDAGAQRAIEAFHLPLAQPSFDFDDPDAPRAGAAVSLRPAPSRKG